MATVTEAATEQRFLIHTADWQMYESLLAAIGDSAIRITYDRGRIELMSPSKDHERFKSLIGRLVEILAFDLNIPIRTQGSTTFKNEALARGLEPDECYYIQNEPLVRGRDGVDNEADPPPDLVVEVEISRSLVQRMGIYAALGVPEIWRFDGETLRVFELLPAGNYAERDASLAFPFLPITEVNRFLAERNSTDEITWARRFSAWVRSTLGAYERPTEE